MMGGPNCSSDSDCNPNSNNPVCCEAEGVCKSSESECSVAGECSANNDCGNGEKCCTGPGRCVSQGTKCSEVVPIGGPWAPLWTGMLIVLGVAFGVYQLNSIEERLRPLGNMSVAMGTRVLVAVGLAIGLTSVSSAYGFQTASQCASTLPPILPWGSYWIGLVLTAGLLGAAGRLALRSSLGPASNTSG
jgi:hypothetical protein